MITLTISQPLASIAPEWSALVERVPDSTPFQRPEWLIPWWHQFGSGSLHAIALRSSSRLVGFVPMFVHEWLGKRQVTLVGNGITDYLGLIAEPAHAAECARLVLLYWLERRTMWDVCDWQDLRADSPLLAAIPAQLGYRVEECLPCTNAELPADADQYEASLPHGLRRTIRISVRRLEREGELKFETIREDPESLVLRDLFRLHESRWAPKGGPGSMLDCPATQTFLIESTRHLSALGKLRLYTMSFRGELAAVICAILDRGRAWGYITGMDPRLSRFSPGSLVLRYAICEAIQEGALAWEFLRGDEPYKVPWGARMIQKSRLRLWPSPLQAPGMSQSLSTQSAIAAF